MSAANKSLGHVVVTGGCGFLGHHIVKLLVERYPASRVSVLDLRTTNNRLSSSSVSYHDGDITDAAAMSELFKTKLAGADVVIHTASPHAVGVPDEVMRKVNVDGTRNLLDAAREAGVKAFVYTSSASVIFDGVIELVNADERYPIVAGKGQPSYYTTTKAWAETAALEANRTPKDSKKPLLTCAIRPAGIFGEGDVQLIPPMLGAYFRGQSRFQLGDNTNLFDFTYVGNVAHAHLLAAAALLATYNLAPTVPIDTERVDGEAFFITNDQPVPFWDFARSVWREAGPPVPIEKTWVLPKDIMMPVGSVLEWICWAIGRKPNITRDQVRYSTVRRYYSIDKAKRRLGYRPIVGLEEGVKRGVKEVLSREGPEWAWVRGGGKPPAKA
ncbi:3-beta hydroxysteroid dehydrogenase/isomerase [Lasiodiplodia theobromae]|uniref:Sterol-4-alpha-carboxylate 3-dehydrogenase ERG26, decarboxylating n=2 Tax=Lasiodiplodia TaxID=66739 RepID=A0A5N5DA00_9PEZI|nr:Sterol-4-alpha-carboxylate 3-dehydrogenase [Lasiodiplodia theobromae]KAF9633248.1 3-beta hydroxysteroid dehydrogenase/isomerase [Lasiodiplodia theobromae]KAK0650454.1 Sterol-4-alpha-carboxylate 3-dehydrogenase [Lasiodiplodia hormozganensis]